MLATLTSAELDTLAALCDESGVLAPNVVSGFDEFMVGYATDRKATTPETDAAAKKQAAEAAASLGMPANLLVGDESSAAAEKATAAADWRPEDEEKYRAAADGEGSGDAAAEQI